MASHHRYYLNLMRSSPDVLRYSNSSGRHSRSKLHGFHNSTARRRGFRMKNHRIYHGFHWNKPPSWHAKHGGY